MSTIKETKEIITFALELGNAFGKAFEDKELTWTDATYFMYAIKEAPAAFLGINEIPSELKEFTAEEQDELKAHIIERFDIPQDNIEEYIEKGLTAALEIYRLVSMFLKKKEEPVA
jgi:hypothetical protein